MLARGLNDCQEAAIGGAKDNQQFLAWGDRERGTEVNFIPGVNPLTLHQIA
jgi:hypothetical protein